MTGRAAGYCAGYPAPGYMNPGPGGGFWGGGRGGGRGWRNWFHATGLTGWQRAAQGQPAFGAGWGYGVPYAGSFTPPTMNAGQELDLLKRQAEYVTGVLEDIKERIEKLAAQPQEQ